MKYSSLFFVLTLAIISGLNVAAQTPTASTSKGPTQIDADSADFDLNGKTATYHGHVHVSQPKMDIRCEWMLAEFSKSAGRVDRITARTNVVIDVIDEKGGTNHLTSDQAIYQFVVQDGTTNETVTFTGDPIVRSGPNRMTGDKIIWNRAQNAFHIDNMRAVGILPDHGSPVPAATNAAPAGANGSQISDTAPGVIKNVDAPSIPPQAPPSAVGK